MRIDLHTHSRVSDGTDTPGDVVRKARAAGLDVVGLTDHDTGAGWSAAQQVADEVGITLVRGMEISTRHHGSSMHLLGYLLDPAHPPLVAALGTILEGRDGRVPAICAKLAELGIEVTEEDVRRGAGQAVPGRPHVADALIAAGVVGSREEAFARFLNPGRPAYVTRHAPALGDAVRLVVEAGGVAVLAHPWGRSRTVDEAALAALAQQGLAGLEVDHQEHSAQDRDRLRAMARNLGLVVTGASDYHGAGKVDHDLGCNTTSPEEYERLLALAATSGRSTGSAGAPGSGRDG